MHMPDSSTISGNLIRNNYGRGIWLDLGSGKNTTVSNNLILNNPTGLDLEIGDAYPHKM
jgi:parallel beta-helix repeat protein